MAKRLEKCSDAELLALTSDRPEAFGVFYQRHARMMISYLMARVGDLEVALDLNAEVFEGALRGRGSFDERIAPARAWLFGIANHRLADSFRDRARVRAIHLKLEMSPVGYTDDAHEEVAQQIDASTAGYLERLKSLTALEREAVLARVVEERDYHEIAAEFEVAPTTIRARVSRGLRQLSRQQDGGLR